jgi:hypothetical protein
MIFIVPVQALAGMVVLPPDLSRLAAAPGAVHVFMQAERLGRHVRVRSLLADSPDGTLLLPLSAGELVDNILAAIPDPPSLPPPACPDAFEAFLDALPE